MTETIDITQSEARRIAQFMKLPRWEKYDDLALVKSVNKGFPPKTVEVVARRIDPDGTFLKATDLVAKSTLSRKIRANQLLSKDDSEALLALSRVFAELMHIYRDDPEKVSRYLLAPLPRLEGRTPLDVAKESTAGADLILKLLAQADAGVAN
ncbi:MAG: hypothetical protein RLZ98_1097 [Pseudomonadota bacterium]|jgi:putative toxin-antitoxin system antitoxin component (TIGR02293 family)